jgi:hypothetical protein
MAFGVPLKLMTAVFPPQIAVVPVIVTSGKATIVSCTGVLGLPIQLLVTLYVSA